MFGLHPLRAVAILLVAATALLPRGSQAADQPVAEKPVYSDGDVFEYVERFESIACKRWEVKGHDADGSLLSQCGDDLAYFSAETGALMRISGKNGEPLVDFQPAAPAIPFPLHVGSKWQGKFRVSTADEIVSPSLDQTCEAVSFETVDVPAGRLQAFRYECKTEWSVWPLHGTVTETGWYAPAAKVVVKVINNADSKWNLELAHYSLK